MAGVAYYGAYNEVYNGRRSAAGILHTVAREATENFVLEWGETSLKPLSALFLD